MALTLRQLRLRAIWLLVLPFLWLAQPTRTYLLTGSALALAGLAIRAWAAGTIHKDQALATGGPYRLTRNPLFLGSLLIGTGVSLCGGHWVWPTLFLVFFATVYTKTMRDESRHLEELFGDAYRAYAATTPSLFPWLRLGTKSSARLKESDRASEREKAPGDEAPGGRFSWQQYARNREWEALLGVLAALAFLLAKVVLR